MDGILNSSVVLLHVLPVFVFHHLKNEIWILIEFRLWQLLGENGLMVLNMQSRIPSGDTQV